MSITEENSYGGRRFSKVKQRLKDRSKVWIRLFQVKLEISDRGSKTYIPKKFYKISGSKKAQKENNVWWRLSGCLGDQNRMLMYILLQAIFTVATMALTVPIFMSYELHLVFQILKVSAAIWNGGQFLVEVMPVKWFSEKKKLEMLPPIISLDDQSLSS
ncbi:putative glycerophosphocholine acyltransferase 1 [Helianthus annuus]|nr:putative glycerophosphocholine acyltransferase 1 [Helianthus annuus]